MNPLDNLRIVLVHPIYGGNVGSVCRAMANTGLKDLVLVNTESSLDWDQARKLAVAAAPILDARREVASVAEALADCGLAFGTTARLGLYRAHARTPRECAPHILETARAGNRVALVFGAENFGLANEELARCTHVIQIPSSPDYPSLNLAQAVLICAYEIFVAAQVYAPPTEPSSIAPLDLRERMLEMWRELLCAVGFIEPEKETHMMMGIRRIFARGQLTENDVRILMGMARQTHWKLRHGLHDHAPPPASMLDRSTQLET